jgi:hypothetical protein
VASPEERRWHYRIPYPEREVLAFDTGAVTLRVLDISEAGLRYLVPEGERPPEPDTELAGLLRLHEQRRVELRAIVSRVDGRKVSCRIFPPGIPLNVMFAEQRWLLRRYPLLFRAAG